MKKILLPIFIILLGIPFVFGQITSAPQSMNYQAVARNSAGEILANTAVSIRISILDETTSGTIVYSETHNPTTNEFGLFSLKIGKGAVISGTFATINWAVKDKFLRVEMDATGGSSYTVMGTTQLVSVPYALFAKGAEYSFWADGADEADYAENANVANSLSGTNDIDNSNEIQELGLSGNTLSLTNGGGSVTLPSLWNDIGNGSISYTGNYIGIHTNSPTADLHFKYIPSGTLSSGHSSIRFQRSNGNESGFSIGHSTGVFGTHAYLSCNDGGIHFSVGDGIHPQMALSSTGNIKLGTNGSYFAEIKEITGTTASSNGYTHLDYPDGYTKENSRVLSVEINYLGDRWVGATNGEIQYNLTNSNITIYYNNSSLYHSKAVRMILMKMPTSSPTVN